MKKHLESYKDLFSKPVLIIGLILMLGADSLFIHSAVRDTGTWLQDTGADALSDIAVASDRYVKIAGVQGTYVLSAGNEITEDDFYKEARRFSEMGSAVRCIALAPDGYLTYIYPHYDLEKSKRQLFSGPWQHWAEKARDTKLDQSFMYDDGMELHRKGLAVYHPIYSLDKNNQFRFWGFSIVAIDFKEFIDEVNLDRLKERGILYTLERTDRNTGENVVIGGSDTTGGKAVTVARTIDGGHWKLILRPANGWFSMPLLLLITWGCFMTTLLVARMAGKNKKLFLEGVTDPLTGIYNRKGGDLAVSRYLKEHENGKALVLFTDIDNFKVINDVHGHEAGDRALQKLVEDGRTIFGAHAIYSRNGGDEFVFFLPYEDLDQAFRQIDSFTKYAHVVHQKKGDISFTLSLGCAMYPQHGRNYRDLCIKADFALYGAKLNGKAGWRLFDGRMINPRKRMEFGFNLSDIAQGMPGAMVVYKDAPGHKILFASSKMVKLYGCRDFDDFMDLTKGCGLNIICREDRSRVSAYIQQLEIIRKEEEGFITYRIRTRDGRLREVASVGRRSENPNFGSVFYVFLFKREVMGKYGSAD